LITKEIEDIQELIELHDPLENSSDDDEEELTEE